MKKFCRLLLLYFLYVICFGLLPFFRQKNISDDYKKSFKLKSLYQNKQAEKNNQHGKIIADNDEARVEKLKAIRHAKESIILSTYRYIVDETGLQFMKELHAAADRGVDVKIIVDGCTLLSSYFNNQYFQVLNDHQNIEFRVYNPINYLKPWTINGRMHDKYILIDGQLVFLGGRNITNRFNTKQFGEVNYDWDTMIYIEKKSPKDSYDQVKGYFDKVWNQATTKDISQVTLAMPASKKAEALESIQQAEIKEDLSRRDYLSQTVPLEKVSLIHNPIHTQAKEPTIFYQITELLKDANHSATIHTPYYIANDKITQELSQIAGQTETNLMTNSVSNSRNQFGAMELCVKEDELVRTGIHLLELQDTHPYHGKVIRIDDDISLVGSFNWDMRSVYINTEMMLVIKGHEYQDQVEEAMKVFEDQSVRVLEDGKKIPPQGQDVKEVSKTAAFVYRILYILSYPIRRLL